MSTYFFVATPYGDLRSPHWQALERVDPGGPEAVLLALHLRDMAASCGRGGLICLPEGKPMSLEQVTLALGYTPGRVRHGLELLSKYDLARPSEDGGIICTDPVLISHLGRLEAAVIKKQLPAGAKPGRKSKFSRSLTGAEKKQWQRTGALPAGVSLVVPQAVANCPPLNRDNYGTPSPQHLDISDIIQCPEINQSTNEFIKKTTTGDGGNPLKKQIAKALSVLDQHDSASLMGLAMAVVCQADHSILDVERAISAGLKAARSPNGPGGLVKTILAQMLDNPPVTLIQPNPAVGSKEEAKRAEEDFLQAELFRRIDSLPTDTKKQINTAAEEECRKIGIIITPDILRATELNVFKKMIKGEKP